MPAMPLRERLDLSDSPHAEGLPAPWPLERAIDPAFRCRTPHGHEDVVR
jgi:hypothetical protein